MQLNLTGIPPEDRAIILEVARTQVEAEPSRYYQAIVTALEGTGRAELRLPDTLEKLEMLMQHVMAVRDKLVELGKPKTAEVFAKLLAHLDEERGPLVAARRQSDLALEEGTPPPEPGDDDWTPEYPPPSARRRSWWGRALKALGLGGE